MTRYRTIEGALKALDKEIFKVKNRALSGLKIVQQTIHESMDESAPLVPVDTGNLRKSFFCVASSGAVYYGANPRFNQTPNKPSDYSDLVDDHQKALKKASRESARKAKKNDGPAISLGLSAYYAPYVHEMYGKTASGNRINWSREGSGPGFFAAAISRILPKVPYIVAKEIKVKK